MRDVIRDALKGSPLFRDVDATRLDMIVSEMERDVVRHSAEQTIFVRGSTLQHLHLLVDGRAEAGIFSQDGHHIRVERIIAPDVLASSILFAPKPVLPVTVTAVTTCTIASLPRERLLDYCRKDRDLLLGLLHDMGRRTTFLAARLRLSEFASLRQKIAAYLSEELERCDGAVIHVSLSREALADVFGVARPSLSRELGNMTREGLIRCDGNTIEILDAAALEALKRGCE